MAKPYTCIGWYTIKRSQPVVQECDDFLLVSTAAAIDRHRRLKTIRIIRVYWFHWFLYIFFEPTLSPVGSEIFTNFLFARAGEKFVFKFLFVSVALMRILVSYRFLRVSNSSKIPKSPEKLLNFKNDS